MLRRYACRHVALVALKKSFEISGATIFVALLRFVLRLYAKIFVALIIYAYILHKICIRTFMQIRSFLRIGKIKQVYPLQLARSRQENL